MRLYFIFVKLLPSGCQSLWHSFQAMKSCISLWSSRLTLKREESYFIMLTPHIITLILLGDLIQCHHQHVQQEIRQVYGSGIPFVSSYSFPIKSLLKIISMQSLNVTAWNRNAKTICLFRILSFSSIFKVFKSLKK